MRQIVGTNNPDDIVGTDEDDRIWGLGGNDNIEGGLGSDIIDGGAGDDILTSTLSTSPEPAELTGGSGNDRLIFSSSGAARGDDGIDTLVVDLSYWANTIAFNGLQGHVAWGHGSDFYNHLYFTGVERLNLQTGSGNDIIDASGFQFANIRAGLGNDQVTTGSGNDQISGGAGRDHILSGDGDDLVRGGIGDDFADGGNGNDKLSGNEGNDTLNGGRGKDSLSGDDGDDTLNGGDGNDVLRGGPGTDTLFGGAGDDYLVNYGADGDTMVGGAGNDTFSAGSQDSVYAGYWFQMSGGAGDDTFSIYSDGGFGSIDGGEGIDALSVQFDDVAPGFIFDAEDYSTIEKFNIDVRSATRGAEVSGGPGDDRIVSSETFREGFSGHDTYDGRAGNDVIYGASGSDSLIGSEGDDRLNGGEGADRLLGGVGADTLTGGPGADTFIWDAASTRDGSLDHVTDFNPEGGDVLLFRDVDMISSFDSFVAASSDTADGVFISFGGDSYGILLENVTLAELTEDNVTFG